MKEHLVFSIKEELKMISKRRHQLILIINHKWKDLSFLDEKLALPQLNINLELSTLLKDIPINKRHRRVVTFLKDVVKQNAIENTIILDHIEVLFDPQLKQDPLKLFEDISRNYILIVNWKGDIINNKLTYAQHEHIEFHSYDEYDAVAINFD
ncbi:hypothetical protein HNQ94_000037 [Salirhabdus euzebyi]|uniref:BREX-3 system P-loop-containing protein BrxF n=1 Tax=Salirhabdus euzebyi TaxID=394506 RepID=A0A841PWE0_9BACI|nr:BREX-3 system P-loop-containing protein BrxF [Salirhabdus euzebyi]MBB6451616.1 hypothetical protein [Salirhabdus euzebyi]